LAAFFRCSSDRREPHPGPLRRADRARAAPGVVPFTLVEPVQQGFEQGAIGRRQGAAIGQDVADRPVGPDPPDIHRLGEVGPGDELQPDGQDAERQVTVHRLARSGHSRNSIGSGRLSVSDTGIPARVNIMTTRNRDQDPGHGPPREFESTRWSLVQAARDGREAEAREALAALCETYWYPLYAFIRRKGHGADEALDLVQGFFARLLERGDLASVDRSKGRLRSFLMASCTHYLANRHDHDRAAKRGGGRTLATIDGLTAEGRYAREPSHEQTAERLFEQRWATTLLDRTLGRLEGEMTAAGKARSFAILRPMLSAGRGRESYDRIAAELGVSNDAARAAAKRLRGRFRAIVREEIARTLEDPADVEDEIRALFSSLGE
jgi:RNA polymerase sigma-70 factor (ECF subfamily)